MLFLVHSSGVFFCCRQHGIGDRVLAGEQQSTYAGVIFVNLPVNLRQPDALLILLASGRPQHLCILQQLPVLHEGIKLRYVPMRAGKPVERVG